MSEKTLTRADMAMECLTCVVLAGDPVSCEFRCGICGGKGRGKRAVNHQRGCPLHVDFMVVRISDVQNLLNCMASTVRGINNAASGIDWTRYVDPSGYITLVTEDDR